MGVKLGGWGPILLLTCLQTFPGLGAAEDLMTSSDDIAAASSSRIFSGSDSREVASQSRSLKDPPSDPVFPHTNSDGNKQDVHRLAKRFYQNTQPLKAHPDEIDNAIKDFYYSEGKDTISSNNRQERQMPEDGKVLYSRPDSRKLFRTEGQKFSSELQEPISHIGQIGLVKESLDSSSESLQQILQSNGDNLIPHSETIPIKNAYLTKIITYNITKLPGNNKNNDFHLETKWNYSTNFNYYDSKERLSNYSVEHSSTQQKIISGGRRKAQDSESVEKPINSSNVDENPNKILGIEDESLHQNNGSELLGSNQGGPTSFVGGQYVEENVLGQTRFGGNNQSHDDIIGDQYYEITGGKDNISQSSNVVSSEFLGGQYIPKKSQSKIIEYKNINRQPGIGKERSVEVSNIFLLSNQTDGDSKSYEVISILGNEPDKPIAGNNTEISKSHFETENNTEVLEQTGGDVEPRISIFEEDDVLPVKTVDNDSEGSGQYLGIFKKDPNTGSYVTEIVGKYFTKDSIDDVSDKMSTGLYEEKNDNEFKDEIEGEASNVQPNNVDYNANLISSTTTGESLLENSLQYLEDPYLNSNTSAEHDVELYAGTTETISGSESFLTPTASHPQEIGLSSVELCFPISNKTNVSLLDLLSGHLYLENRGKKLPIYLNDNPMKNCTSGTEKCKLYVNFEKHQQLLIEESPNTKSQRYRRDTGPVMSENRIANLTEKLDLKSKNHLAGNESDRSKFLGQILSDSLTEQLLKQKLKSSDNKDKKMYSEMQNSDELPLQFNLQLQPQKSNQILKDGVNNNVPLSVKKEKHISPSNLNSKGITLYNIESTETSLDDISRRRTSLTRQKSEHKRPVRTILTSRLETKLSPGTDCGCSTILLKSVPPTPSSTDFVTKRWDIVTNIVHAVKNWAIINH